MMQDVIDVIFYDIPMVQRILSWTNHDRSMTRFINKYHITYKHACKMHSMCIFKHIEQRGARLSKWIFVEAIKWNFLPLVKYIHSMDRQHYYKKNNHAWDWCVKNNNNAMYKFLLAILENKDVNITDFTIDRYINSNQYPYRPIPWNMNKINLSEKTYNYFIRRAERNNIRDTINKLQEKYNQHIYIYSDNFLMI